ncbi:MAG: hypothetical protein AABM67_11150 [Acidobacteriota bacterium]
MSETITRAANSFKFGKERTRRTRLSKLLLLTAHCSLLTFLAHCALLTADAQTVADKTVASVTNGSRATPDLITYSDLVWQLALEPNTPFAEKPSSEQLNRALRLVEDQLLILQEARKLPVADTSEARKDFDDAVQKKRDELAQAFGSRSRLEERMTRVGLTSEQLDATLRDRETIERYLDFRFRAFVLISQKEITDRYNQETAPLRNSGRIVPTLEQARARIEHDLTEEKIATEIDTFIDNLRDQPGTEIVILSPV